MIRVLVTCPPMIGMMQELERLFDELGAKPHCPAVQQTMSESELCDLVPQYDGWIIGDDPASRRVFEAGAGGNLRAAVKWGVGIDNVDFDGARACGIPVTHTPGMFGEEVADLAMCYLIALARQTHAIDAGVKRGKWPKPRGISLAGRTLGIVGLGDIGRNLVGRAQASGLRIIGYDPGVDGAALPGDLRLAVWPERLGECDFIAFTCALNEQNRHMLNDETMSMARQGVMIVNVARGPLINESVLVDALDTGRVASAALDVFETEPLPAESDLRRFPQCIFGSHNASNTTDAVRRTSELAIELLFNFLKRAEK